jgi:phospholipid transport system substrate-binding protein
LLRCFRLVAQHAQAVDSSAPIRLIKTVTQQVVDAVRSDKSIQQGDISHITQLVNEKILPYTDFRRTTQLAMGRNWRTATPEQQNAVVEQFKMLLIRTYSGASGAGQATSRSSTSRSA